MEKYRRVDVTKAREFLAELKGCKSSNKLVGIVILTNILCKIGFEGPLPQSGSKLPFYSTILTQHPKYPHGRILIAEFHGKKKMTHYRNFDKHCLEQVEFVLDYIEENNLFCDEGEIRHV